VLRIAGLLAFARIAGLLAVIALVGLALGGDRHRNVRHTESRGRAPGLPIALPPRMPPEPLYSDFTDMVGSK